MQFSLELPIQNVEAPADFVSGAAVRDVTRAAKAAGFAAVNTTDHPAPDAKWVDAGGHHALDPFVALSFAASADPDIRLLTNIYVAGYRNPFLGANSVHSLQLLSGERLILGVAAGYLKPEFHALGADFNNRGERFDTALEALSRLCSGEEVALDGADFSARGVRLRPTPPSAARPPVWVGGNSPKALRRAAWYDGWAPFHTAGYSKASRTVPIESIDDLARGITAVTAMAGDNGRSAPFDICWSESLLGNMSADEKCSRIAALQALGVTWMTITLYGADRTELLANIEAFGREVIAEMAPPA